MSEIVIKPMETDAETEGKAYVHWKSWQEAYAGIVDPAYLAALTLDKCQGIARRWPDRVLVAKDAALEKLKGFGRVALWVLEDNKRAIRFYEKRGFHPDGARRTLKLGTQIGEIRMALDRRTRPEGVLTI